MKKSGKTKKWIVSIALFIILMGTLHSCLQFRMSKSEIDRFFADKKEKGKIITYQEGFRIINYVIVGDELKPLVIFVHGSPGSLSAFIDFLGDSSLLRQAQLISVDRPGFGHANFGLAEPSLQKQAALLKSIIDKNKHDRPVFLVGHSLGGPLIARVAMDYPKLVDGLIMVAPSIDPALEPHEWFRAPLATPFLSWILPRSFRASNDEIYQLKPELENMLPLWSKVTTPSIVIQGKKDRFVPYQNAFFAQEKMVNASVTLVMVDTMDHFVPWSNPELIHQAISDMINLHGKTARK
jgi:pimeloyl-ACP methyl ester carboxylesterase